MHLPGLTFLRCHGYPWAPAILQKSIQSYWTIRKVSLIDFHVVLKGAELLFFRLKILFNWKIIVVEVTETFLSPGNQRRKGPSLNLLRDLCSGASSGCKTDNPNLCNVDTFVMTTLCAICSFAGLPQGRLILGMDKFCLWNCGLFFCLLATLIKITSSAWNTALLGYLNSAPKNFSAFPWPFVQMYFNYEKEPLGLTPYSYYIFIMNSSF